MSSLAASRADNFYFPPEWRPEYGGISKFNGSKGANQFEQFGIMRFEMPFDGWCESCGYHIGKGLRFNAKKEKEGKYFSTQIFSFEMKCYGCPQRFKVITDPENRTYKFTDGLRKHEQDYEVTADDAVIDVADEDTKKKLHQDPMFRMEHEKESVERFKTEKDRFEKLTNIQEVQHKDDYDRNSLLRSKNRKRRRQDLALKEEAKAKNLGIPLLECSAEDAIGAREAKFKLQQSRNQKFKVLEKEKMLSIQKSSIFSNSQNKMKSSHSKSRNSEEMKKMSQEKKAQLAMENKKKCSLDMKKIKFKDETQKKDISKPKIVIKCLKPVMNEKKIEKKSGNALDLLGNYNDDDD